MSAATTEPAKEGRFAWLRPPKGGPGGTMSIWDHLRELRYRVTISAFAVVVAGLASIFFYRTLVGIVMAPWLSAQSALKAARPDANLMVVNNGVTSSFTFAVVLCVVAGILMATPVWVYQLWAFIAPGLLAVQLPERQQGREAHLPVRVREEGRQRPDPGGRPDEAQRLGRQRPDRR